MTWLAAIADSAGAAAWGAAPVLAGTVDGLLFSAREIRLLAWGGGLAVALLFALLGKWRPFKALGAGLMSVPLWFTFWGILDSIEVLVATTDVLIPYTKSELSRLYARKLLADVGYVGVGFLLVASDGRSSELWRMSPRAVADALVRRGFPTGRRSELDSIAVGFLSFPAFLFAAIAIDWILYNTPGLVNGDESSVWDNMTPYAAILLALAAGLGEEIVFRGVLQTSLSRFMPVWLAVVLQAVFFGFAHAGYGTWAHVISPLLFGLLTGFMAARWGLWAPIVLHVLIDILAFSGDTLGRYPWWWNTLTALLLLNVVVSFAWAVRWLWVRLVVRRPPPMHA